jgi:hypothetical protein
MAIAFRSVGTRLKADVSLTGTPQSVGMPAGHVSADFLLMHVVTDDNTGPGTPSGWSKLFEVSPGTSTWSPYAGYPRTTVFYRIDSGALGSSVSVDFDVSAWPTGKPYVLAYIAAWSGCDTTNPVGEWSTSTDPANTAAQAHPQLSLAANNCWLLTLRSVNADAAKTFTVSVGTDSERVDDSHGSPAAPSFALYDSNAALSTGLQTQRTTTASAVVQYGSTMASIALRPASAASAVTALAGTAAISFAAQAPAVSAVQGPWDLCSANGLPDYFLGIDWDQSGLTVPGTVLNANPYVETDLTDWSTTNSTQARRTGIITGQTPVLETTSSTGSSPRSETGQKAVTTGQPYRAYGWLMAPAALPSTAQLNINWFDAGHSYLSTDSNSLTLTPGQWTLFDKTSTAPASAAYATVLQVIGGTPGAGYKLYGYGLMLIDPSTSGTVQTPGPGEDVTQEEIDDVVISYGRDQDRQLSPAAIGSASLRLINVSRYYSPENPDSPLYGNLDPARDARFDVTWAGGVFPLFRGKIDDFTVNASFTDRTVSFTFLDGMALLQGFQLSTLVYSALRTGEIIDLILDEAGWTGGRDLDTGATVVKYWWAEGTDALRAIQDMVKSEGPPAVAFVGPDGTFHFHDRHHRLQNSESLNVQGSYAVAAVGCASPAVTGFDIAQPFVYEHGWRDIVNSVVFEVPDRIPAPSLSDVWKSEDSIVLSTGQSVDIDVSASDPFMDALTPVEGTDFTKTGSGSVSVVLSRTSGQSARITLMASGNNAVVTDLKLRARAIPVSNTIKVVRQDTGSITAHGEKNYPDEAPWAGVNDAGAIADTILLHYARRRPTVQLRVLTQDPAHFTQVLQRTIGDRIRIRNDELGLNGDFFVERVTHTIRRFNQTGKPPVHAVVLGCEKDEDVIANPFTFDKRGAGFDDGTFDTILTDTPDTVFTFDHLTQGQFDVGLFGT